MGTEAAEEKSNQACSPPTPQERWEQQPGAAPAPRQLMLTAHLTGNFHGLVR